MQEETIEQNSNGSFLLQDRDEDKVYGTSALSLDEIEEIINEMRF